MADKFRRTGRWRGMIDAVLLGAAVMLMVAGSALAAPAGNQLLAVKMESGAASPTVLGD